MTQKLDYEDGFGRPNGDLTVGVRAWANDNVRYVDANIILTVKDVNDNFPIFSKTVSDFMTFRKARLCNIQIFSKL